MMNFDELKKYIRNIEYELEYGEEQNAERVAVNVKCLRSVIDFANEAIARQSVTSEEVAEAIAKIEKIVSFDKEHGYRVNNCHSMHIRDIKTALVALQECQPTISKMETVEPCEWCDDNWVYSDGHFGRYDTEEIKYLELRAWHYCPNCGRRLT